MNKRIIALILISSAFCLAACSNMYTSVSTDVSLPEMETLSPEIGMGDSAGPMGGMDMSGDMEMDEATGVSGIHIYTGEGNVIYEAPYLSISEGSVEAGVLYTVKLDVGDVQYEYNNVDLTDYSNLEAEETNAGWVLIVNGTTYSPVGG